MKISSFIKSQMKVRQKDFEEASRILEAELTGTNEDLQYLEAIAHYQWWAGNEEKAILTAKKALLIDPHGFDMAKMLSVIYAERENHDEAIKFVKIAVQNYQPENPYVIPGWVSSCLKLGGKFSARLRQIEKTAEEDLEDPNKGRREWRAWAEEYMSWYDETIGK
jgi:tetratricopeptide (TPR) repeat protein